MGKLDEPVLNYLKSCNGGATIGMVRDHLATLGIKRTHSGVRIMLYKLFAVRKADVPVMDGNPMFWKAV